MHIGVLLLAIPCFLFLSALAVAFALSTAVGPLQVCCGPLLGFSGLSPLRVQRLACVPCVAGTSGLAVWVASLCSGHQWVGSVGCLLALVLAACFHPGSLVLGFLGEVDALLLPSPSPLHDVCLAPYGVCGSVASG